MFEVRMTTPRTNQRDQFHGEYAYLSRHRLKSKAKESMKKNEGLRRAARATLYIVKIDGTQEQLV